MKLCRLHRDSQMAQLFKKLMLLFKKKKTTSVLLDYNIGNLSAKLERIQLDLYRLRHEDSGIMIKEAIQTARNIQILEINRFNPNKSNVEQLSHQQGRLEALTDLARFIELAFDAEYHKQRQAAHPQTAKPRILVKKQQATEPVI